ncbi:MAG: ATPase [Planctomycetaceae bacterium]
MIDWTPPGSSSPSSERSASRSGGKAATATTRGAGSELFDDIFGSSEHAAGVPRATPAPLPPVSDRLTSVPAPRGPTSIDESGLTVMQVANLLLKQLYLQGNLLGIQLARHARLPFRIVEEPLRLLKDEKCIEVSSGELIGPASYRFQLTEQGRRRAHDAFEQCRYVGPAPVSLQAYIDQCALQSVAGTTCNADKLLAAFNELIIPPALLEELGPAVCSGKSIFVYGPPGNGKSMVAKGLGKFLNQNGGEIYVPYAIQTEGAIITIFDPTLHQATDQPEADSFRPEASGADSDRPRKSHEPDLRWRRIRRPVVMTGGELTLDMLDLRYNRTSNFYTAPLHIKANGGVFLIDDFGRQIVSPRDLLNRWILPLEDRIDYMTLATGKKFSVPFEQLIVFSTNLDPRELVDEAFLRRIRHKIKIDSPSRELFTDIFERCCRERRIPFSQAAVDYLFSRYYIQGKPPRSSDPRDLLEIVQSICRFRNDEVLLTPDLIGEAAERFFCQL